MPCVDCWNEARSRVERHKFLNLPDLVMLGACTGGVVRFAEVFPGGTPLTRAAIVKGVEEYLDVSWLVKALTGKVLEDDDDYERSCERIYDAETRLDNKRHSKKITAKEYSAGLTKLEAREKRLDVKTAWRLLRDWMER